MGYYHTREPFGDLSYHHAATLIVAVISQVRTQSGMHSPSRLEGSLRNSRGKLPRISYGTKYRPPTAFGELHEPFYTTVSAADLLAPAVS